MRLRQQPRFASYRSSEVDRQHPSLRPETPRQLLLDSRTGPDSPTALLAQERPFHPRLCTLPPLSTSKPSQRASKGQSERCRLRSLTEPSRPTLLAGASLTRTGIWSASQRLLPKPPVQRRLTRQQKVSLYPRLPRIAVELSRIA